MGECHCVSGSGRCIYITYLIFCPLLVILVNYIRVCVISKYNVNKLLIIIMGSVIISLLTEVYET